MGSLRFLFATFSALFFILVSANPAAAQVNFANPWRSECVKLGDVATIQGLECVFERVVGSVLFIAGIALFILIVWGGFSYMTAGGDAQKAEGAKKILTYAIGGLVLLVLSVVILSVIGSFTGVTGVGDFKITR